MLALRTEDPNSGPLPTQSHQHGIAVPCALQPQQGAADAAE